MPPVVTRFAPSPTGSLHIGGARTALFNWLYARHTGGTFLLRVEDTDRERSTKAAVDVIFDGLDWLGLDPDAPAVFQSQYAERHKEVVGQLVERGRAYRCYMTVEELSAEREIARAEGRAVRSPWRDRDAPAGENRPFVIRFKGPTDGETVIEDLIRGAVRWQNKELDDLILLRSDGAPTYNLAVVVDDHDMGVTHVIRGDDHLSNAARQSAIYKAMDWPTPVFAHVPMIHGPDGAKLSKRHGAQAVGEFREMGYLPEAMRNYLAKLGWGHGDDEIFSDEQAIAWFDVKDVVKAPARLNWAKLNHINNHYIRNSEDDRLALLAGELMAHKGENVDAEAETRLRDAIPLIKEGAKTLHDLPALAGFALARRPLTLDEKTRGLLDEEGRGRLSRLRDRLAIQSPWEIADLEAMLKEFAASEGVGFGKIGPVLRGALTGGTPSPDLARTLFALRRDEALGRIDDALSSLA